MSEEKVILTNEAGESEEMTLWHFLNWFFNGIQGKPVTSDFTKNDEIEFTYLDSDGNTPVRRKYHLKLLKPS